MRRPLILTFVLISLTLLWLGLATSTWWTIAGGVTAAAAAAWIATEP